METRFWHGASDDMRLECARVGAIDGQFCLETSDHSRNVSIWQPEASILPRAQHFLEYTEDNLMARATRKMLHLLCRVEQNTCVTQSLLCARALGK